MIKYLIFGDGFIGRKFKEALGNEAEISRIDICDREEVRSVLYHLNPEVVINCAGKTGKPNIDWCETNKDETLRSNVTGAFTLAHSCIEMGVYMVHIGSGCIYQGDNGGLGFKEEDRVEIEDIPSFYSLTKSISEDMLRYFPILQLRIRMPIDDDLENPRNFVTKIISYEKVINEPNSMTIIDDLILAANILIDKKKTGVYNITNRGSVTHEEVLQMYKEIVDFDFEYEIIPTDELHTLAGRSNCILNTEKLESEGIMLSDIKSGIRDILISSAG